MNPLRSLLLCVLIVPAALRGPVWAASERGALSDEGVELVNNQPFRIRLPLWLHQPPGSRFTSAAAVQQVGSDTVLIADVGPHQRKFVSFSTLVRGPDVFDLTPAAAGVRLKYQGEDAGSLSWGIVLKPVTGSPSVPPDLSATFEPLALTFKRAATGPVCEVWTAETLTSGLRLTVELIAYRQGFLDVNARLANEAATPPGRVYAAVVARWIQPVVQSRALCYDHRVSELPPRAQSPFRAGEGRHLYTQRGADWIATEFRTGIAVAWLNDFAPSFTLLDPGTRNTFRQRRYATGSVPQLGQEVETTEDRLYSITEIARSNIRSYRDRVIENTLPARGEGVAFSSRLVFSPRPLPADEVDRMLVGYTGYNAQTTNATGVQVAFGTASVRFGTAYFPYSTLGENFDRWKLPGMDRESFWPLAADTVRRWRAFADDIRRDLRIIKAMGFQLVRLHHLELLAPLPAEVRDEYLDFLFGELRHLQLRAMLDVYAEPASIAALVKRYADVVDSVELENEILIWGIPLDRPAQWKAAYAAIKQAAPQVQVHLTGYNNTGMFLRLQNLGVPFDRIGLHSYVDSLAAIPSGRGYALALGSLGTKLGKPPVITEWNWRGLSRMTPEARAAVYPSIFDNVLATRAIPELHQFQFNETLAPNPRVGRGNILRHYEIVHLSRRPKLEAFELMKLMHTYAAPDDSLRRLDVPPVDLELDPAGSGVARMSITNRDASPVRLRLVLETPSDLTAELAHLPELALAAGESAIVPIRLQATGNAPGFYHCFLRLEAEGAPVRYGWIQARRAGRPPCDTTPASNVQYPQGVKRTLALDLSAPSVVVYGPDAPVLEVETAIALAETLESATGRVIDAVPFDALGEPAKKERMLLIVGTPRSNPLLAHIDHGLDLKAGVILSEENAGGTPAHLLVAGDTAQAVENAGMDLLLRYWRFAKDSAARRVGVVEKTLPRGVDPTKLP